MLKRLFMVGIFLMAAATISSAQEKKDDKEKGGDSPTAASVNIQSPVIVREDKSKALPVVVTFSEMNPMDRVLKILTVLLLFAGVLYLILIRSDIEQLKDQKSGG